MYNKDQETTGDIYNQNEKMNIPNDLPNIKVAGDTADRAKEVRLKLNCKRVRDIYEYLCEKNEFLEKWVS